MLEGKKILVTGAAGMLAGDVAPRLRAAGAELHLADVRAGERADGSFVACDITDAGSVQRLLERLRPDWVINCAAFTRVDDAESEPEPAFLVNATGPGNLAKAARSCAAAMLHVSTDYLFGGRGADLSQRRPLRETDPVFPCGIYGQSKRYGDELVVATLPENHVIVRTSWLHGAHGHNFVHAILRLARERDELKVVDDQTGSPTWTGWLADAIVALVARDARGTYHASSRGDITWFEFARGIVEEAGIEVSLQPQTTEELARPAPRPAYSTLAVDKLEGFLERPAPTWREGLRQHLAAIGELKEI
ncbi:MAG: dTDP-4-dehydrorhamnose reductase [Bdellovibrionales bacterium]|nr:dTDP-4-dehydrorhamnose reductase [Bdellovibrionales bacterium]